MHSANFKLLLNILVVWVSTKIVESKHLYFNFNVAYMSGTPDGVSGAQILAVNGQFPGPEIRCKVGDTVHVKVTNNIRNKNGKTYPTTIHWHGLLMEGLAFADGPDHITQCPIQYGKTYEYVFTPVHSGTHWWHSHYSWQYSEGMYGALIVESQTEPYKHLYDREITLLLGDWYHLSGQETTDWLLSKANEAARAAMPDSALMNGNGFYPCQFARRKGLPCKENKEEVFTVKKGERIRFRLINTAAILTFQFSIDDHFGYTVIQADGIDTVQVKCDSVILAPGQRYSVVINMNSNKHPSERLEIRSKTVNRFPEVANLNHNPYPEALHKYSGNAHARLRYDARYQRSASEQAVPGRDMAAREINGPVRTRRRTIFTNKLKPKVCNKPNLPPGADGTAVRSDLLDYTLEIATSPPPMKSRDDRTVRRQWSVLNENDLQPMDKKPAPSRADEKFELNVNYITNHVTFNGDAFHPEGIPYLFRMILNKAIPYSASVLRISKGQVVQVKVTNTRGNAHPFHLHGHSFWVTGSGPKDGAVSWTPNGVRRDTFVVPGLHSTYIKFVADNPGAWLFHCHINWHHQMGMSAVFIESKGDTVSSYREIPQTSVQVCKDAGINIY